MRKRGAALVFLAIASVLVFLWRESAPKPVSKGNSVASVPGRGEEPTAALAQGPRRLEYPSGAANLRAPAGLSNLSAIEAQKAFVRSKILSAPPATMPELTNIAAGVVLENMRSVFRQYAERFGGNPIGTNPEITADLNGGNSKQVQFINSEDGLRINESGELVDSWGTPFFFHQLSAREMEIHSAGPDRVMWTGDDLVIK
jgi:hypothetical protein